MELKLRPIRSTARRLSLLIVPYGIEILPLNPPFHLAAAFNRTLWN